MSLAMFKKIFCPETMMKVIYRELKKSDPEYISELNELQTAICKMKELVGEERSIEVDAAISEEEQTIGERLIFLFWQGVQLNLACFRDPTQRQFLELDYEEIHREALMNECFPKQPQGFTTEFIESLPEETQKYLEKIIGYYCYLETVAYKFVHYQGFLFGNQFLPQVVSGYRSCSDISERYLAKLKQDLDLFFINQSVNQ